MSEEEPAGDASDAAGREAPEPAGAREVLLRAGLGGLLAALAGIAFVVLADEWSSWVFFVFMGLFLGGLTGLAGFVERRGAGRGWPAQVGLALALFAGALVWGTASIFQAMWTQAALRGGPDVASAELQRFLGRVAAEPEPLLRIFVPLGAVIAAAALVRMRDGRWRAHLAVGGLTLGAGQLVAGEPKFRQLAFVLGAGLLLAGWFSAWAAGVLARRWWPAPATDRGPGPAASAPAP